MKKIIVILLVIIAFSCKKETKKEVEKKEVHKIEKNNFPLELNKTFDKHGGLNIWRKVQTLSFNKGEEVHTIDLHSRKTLINTPKYSLGFNGEKVWLSEDEKGIYKGNPTFYYNLYFYFYAMPFVLADNGITYEKAADLVFEGSHYPGYKISYKEHVGNSSKDNYIVYYHPETYQMEWLAYTVTFKSKKISEKYNIIKYDKWEKVNGFLLPKQIVWYQKNEKGMPTEPLKSKVEFTLPLISKGKLADSFFNQPGE